MSTITFSRFQYFPSSTTYANIARIDYGAPDIVLEEVGVHEVYNESLGFSRLYTDKGDLLVLVSVGYGSGWSTDPYMHKNVSRRLLMDSRIVRFFYDTYIAPLIGKPRSCGCCSLLCQCRPDKAPMEKLLKELGLPDVDLGGLRDLEIQSVPANKQFRVQSYDGAESITLFDPPSWEMS